MVHPANKQLPYPDSNLSKSSRGAPSFDYAGNLGRVMCVLTPRNWLRNVHLRASKMHLCSLTLKILYARLKNSKWTISDVLLMLTS
jgi:hypothetical protein